MCLSTNRRFPSSNSEIFNTEILAAINLVIYIRLPSENRPLHWKCPNIPERKKHKVFLVTLESSKKRPRDYPFRFGDVSHDVVQGLVASGLLRVLIKLHILSPAPNLEEHTLKEGSGINLQVIFMYIKVNLLFPNLGQRI